MARYLLCSIPILRQPLRNLRHNALVRAHRLTITLVRVDLISGSTVGTGQAVCGALPDCPGKNKAVLCALVSPHAKHSSGPTVPRCPKLVRVSATRAARRHLTILTLYSQTGKSEA